jgi:hypothetical protein
VATGLTEVYDADLKSYFDTIPHDRLLRCLEQRISDRTVLKLIRQWLAAPLIETDEHGRTTATRPKQGTPQGESSRPCWRTSTCIGSRGGSSVPTVPALGRAPNWCATPMTLWSWPVTNRSG